MSDLSANVYINFQGRAREAMEFYHDALGGKLHLLTYNSDGPPKEAAPGDPIMHSALQSDGLLIMGSDVLPDYPPTVGDNIGISLSGSDRDFLTVAFSRLSSDGTVKQELKQESWGDTFGYFEDKFGVTWMVNISGNDR